MRTSSFILIHLRSFALVFFMAIAVMVQGQTYEQFLKYEGVATLAALAHPTNNFQGGKYWVYDGKVVIEMFYEGNIRTKVRLDVKNGAVTGVYTLYDNDWFPPFLGIELMKDVLYKLLEEVESSGKVTSSYEKWLNKTVYDFTGKEIVMLVMTLSWLGY